MKGKYFAKPLNSKVYHVFENGMSLCCRMAILRPNPDLCEPVQGTETWSKGQDCKSCFKKANLKIN